MADVVIRFNSSDNATPTIDNIRQSVQSLQKSISEFGGFSDLNKTIEGLDKSVAALNNVVATLESSIINVADSLTSAKESSENFADAVNNIDTQGLLDVQKNAEESAKALDDANKSTENLSKSVKDIKTDGLDNVANQAKATTSAINSTNAAVGNATRAQQQNTNAQTEATQAQTQSAKAISLFSAEQQEAIQETQRGIQVIDNYAKIVQSSSKQVINLIQTYERGLKIINLFTLGLNKKTIRFQTALRYIKLGVRVLSQLSSRIAHGNSVVGAFANSLRYNNRTLTGWLDIIAKGIAVVSFFLNTILKLPPIIEDIANTFDTSSKLGSFFKNVLINIAKGVDSAAGSTRSFLGLLTTINSTVAKFADSRLGKFFRGLAGSIREANNEQQKLQSGFEKLRAAGIHPVGGGAPGPGETPRRTINRGSLDPNDLSSTLGPNGPNTSLKESNIAQETYTGIVKGAAQAQKSQEQLNESVKDGGSIFQTAGELMKKAIGRIKEEFVDTGKEGGKLFRLWSRLGIAIASSIYIFNTLTSSANSLTGAVVQATQNFETMNSTLQVTERDTVRISNKLIELNKVVTGISLDTLLVGFTQLRIAGQTVDQSIINLEAIAKSTSELGKSSDVTARVVTQLTQAYSSNVAEAQDLKTIFREIPQISAAATKALGVQIQGWKDLADVVRENENLDLRTALNRTLTELNRTAIGGDPNTYAVQLERFRENATDLARQIGETIVPALTRAFTIINEWANSGGIQTLVNLFNLFIKVLVPLGVTLTVVFHYKKFALIIQFGNILVETVKKGIAAVRNLNKQIITSSSSIGKTLKDVSGRVDTELGTSSRYAKTLKFAQQHAGSFFTRFQNLGNIVKNVFSSFRGFDSVFNRLGVGLDRFSTITTNVFRGFRTSILNALNGIDRGILSAFNRIIIGLNGLETSILKFTTKTLGSLTLGVLNTSRVLGTVFSKSLLGISKVVDSVLVTIGTNIQIGLRAFVSALAIVDKREFGVILDSTKEMIVRFLRLDQAVARTFNSFIRFSGGKFFDGINAGLRGIANTGVSLATGLQNFESAISSAISSTFDFARSTVRNLESAYVGMTNALRRIGKSVDDTLGMTYVRTINLSYKATDSFTARLRNLGGTISNTFRNLGPNITSTFQNLEVRLYSLTHQGIGGLTLSILNASRILGGAFAKSLLTVAKTIDNLAVSLGSNIQIGLRAFVSALAIVDKREFGVILDSTKEMIVRFLRLDQAVARTFNSFIRFSGNNFSNTIVSGLRNIANTANYLVVSLHNLETILFSTIRSTFSFGRSLKQTFLNLGTNTISFFQNFDTSIANIATAVSNFSKSTATSLRDTISNVINYFQNFDSTLKKARDTIVDISGGVDLEETGKKVVDSISNIDISTKRLTPAIFNLGRTFYNVGKVTIPFVVKRLAIFSGVIKSLLLELAPMVLLVGTITLATQAWATANELNKKTIEEQEKALTGLRAVILDLVEIIPNATRTDNFKNLRDFQQRLIEQMKEYQEEIEDAGKFWNRLIDRVANRRSFLDITTIFKDRPFSIVEFRIENAQKAIADLNDQYKLINDIIDNNADEESKINSLLKLRVKFWEQIRKQQNVVWLAARSYRSDQKTSQLEELRIQEKILERMQLQTQTIENQISLIAKRNQIEESELDKRVSQRREQTLTSSPDLRNINQHIQNLQQQRSQLLSSFLTPIPQDLLDQRSRLADFLEDEENITLKTYERTQLRIKLIDQEINAIKAKNKLELNSLSTERLRQALLRETTIKMELARSNLSDQSRAYYQDILNNINQTISSEKEYIQTIKTQTDELNRQIASFEKRRQVIIDTLEEEQIQPFARKEERRLLATIAPRPIEVAKAEEQVRELEERLNKVRQEENRQNIIETSKELITAYSNLNQLRIRIEKSTAKEQLDDVKKTAQERKKIEEQLLADIYKINIETNKNINKVHEDTNKELEKRRVEGLPSLLDSATFRENQEATKELFEELQTAHQRMEGLQIAVSKSVDLVRNNILRSASDLKISFTDAFDSIGKAVDSFVDKYNYINSITYTIKEGFELIFPAIIKDVEDFTEKFDGLSQKQRELLPTILRYKTALNETFTNISNPIKKFVDDIQNNNLLGRVFQPGIVDRARKLRQDVIAKELEGLNEQSERLNRDRLQKVQGQFQFAFDSIDRAISSYDLSATPIENIKKIGAAFLSSSIRILIQSKINFLIQKKFDDQLTAAKLANLAKVTAANQAAGLAAVGTNVGTGVTAAAVSSTVGTVTSAVSVLGTLSGLSFLLKIGNNEARAIGYEIDTSKSNYRY